MGGKIGISEFAFLPFLFFVYTNQLPRHTAMQEKTRTSHAHEIQTGLLNGPLGSFFYGKIVLFFTSTTSETSFFVFANTKLPHLPDTTLLALKQGEKGVIYRVRALLKNFILDLDILLLRMGWIVCVTFFDFFDLCLPVVLFLCEDIWPALHQGVGLFSRLAQAPVTGC
jgi:hypothetical protein